MGIKPRCLRELVRTHCGSQSLPSRSPNTMSTRFLLALCLVLLVLSCEVQGAQLLPQDEPASPPLLAQVRESLSSYWSSAKAAAQGLYQKTYLNDMDEKLRDLYTKSSEAMSTYAGIFTDQLFTLLKGD